MSTRVYHSDYTAIVYEPGARQWRVITDGSSGQTRSQVRALALEAISLRAFKGRHSRITNLRLIRYGATMPPHPKYPKKNWK